MERAPVRRYHAHQRTITREQRRRLTGANTGLPEDGQVLRPGHEFALLDVFDDDTATFTQRHTTRRTSRVNPHPLPEHFGLRIEPAVGQKVKLAARPALGIEHLKTDAVRSHDGHAAIHYLFVQHLRILLSDNLSTHAL